MPTTGRSLAASCVRPVMPDLRRQASAIFRGQGHKLAPQRLEDNGQLGRCRTGLVLVEQGIVDRVAAGGRAGARRRVPTEG